MRALALTAAVAFLLLPSLGHLSETGCAAEPRGEYRERPFEGFGAGTPGGQGGETYEVTCLADSGPGTLRDAVSEPNRIVEFTIAGAIELESQIRITTHHLTIDGSTAPGPGITIVPANSGVTSSLIDLRGCNDIILRHVRICDAPDSSIGDNLRIWDGANNILVDHCSLRRAGDGSLDISNDAHDVTVQWSIVAETVKNSLVRTNVDNLSLHHNLFVLGDERNPQIQDNSFVDMVNNVIFGWSGNYGTRVRLGADVNLVANVWMPGPGSDASDALVITGDAGLVYMEGNQIPPSCHAEPTTGTRRPAPPVTEMTAQEALEAVMAEAGAFPRDNEDQQYVATAAGTAVEPMSWSQIKSIFR
jgi:pectate lyase